MANHIVIPSPQRRLPPSPAPGATSARLRSSDVPASPSRGCFSSSPLLLLVAQDHPRPQDPSITSPRRSQVHQQPRLPGSSTAPGPPSPRSITSPRRSQVHHQPQALPGPSPAQARRGRSNSALSPCRRRSSSSTSPEKQGKARHSTILLFSSMAMHDTARSDHALLQAVILLFSSGTTRHSGGGHVDQHGDINMEEEGVDPGQDAVGEYNLVHCSTHTACEFIPMIQDFVLHAAGCYQWPCGQ